MAVLRIALCLLLGVVAVGCADDGGFIEAAPYGSDEFVGVWGGSGSGPNDFLVVGEATEVNKLAAVDHVAAFNVSGEMFVVAAFPDLLESASADVFAVDVGSAEPVVATLVNDVGEASGAVAADGDLVAVTVATVPGVAGANHIVLYDLAAGTRRVVDGLDLPEYVSWLKLEGSTLQFGSAVSGDCVAGRVDLVAADTVTCVVERSQLDRIGLGEVYRVLASCSGGYFIAVSATTYSSTFDLVRADQQDVVALGVYKGGRPRADCSGRLVVVDSPGLRGQLREYTFDID